MLLICLSLMTNDVKHLFMCLFTISVFLFFFFFFGVVSVQIFVHLKNQIVFSLMGLESSLYILDTSQSFVDV